MDGPFFATLSTLGAGHEPKLYGPAHLAWLALLLALCLCLGPAYARWGEGARRRCRRVLAGAMVGDELTKYLLTLAAGAFDASLLPLHLCSINIFVAAAHALRPRLVLAELLFAVCLPGAAAALLFPAWTALPSWSFMSLHSFSVHILLFLYPFLLLCGGFQPAFGRLTRALPACAAVVAAIFLLNRRLGTNFMFLNGAGANNPLALLEARLGTPGYLATLPLVLSLVWCALYGCAAFWRRQ